MEPVGEVTEVTWVLPFSLKRNEVVKGRRPSVGHPGHPLRVEKVVEVAWLADYLLQQSRLHTPQKEKVLHLAHLDHLRHP